MFGLMRGLAPRLWSEKVEPDRRDPRLEALEDVQVEAELEIGNRYIDGTITRIDSRKVCVKLDRTPDECGVFIGQQVLLHPHSGQSLACVVRHFSGGKLYLKFLTGVTLSAFSDATDPFRRTFQRAGRAPVRLPATILGERAEYPCMILNLSCGGALVSLKEPIRPGEAVMLFPDMLRPQGGYVRWRKEGKAGIMFNRLLSLKDAETVADNFAIHPVWLGEIAQCHCD